MSKEKSKNKNHTSHFALHTSNKGITLIALIITIIVMLILTGVTLTVTLGENGLINKAKDAALQMEIEQDREELLSAVVGAIGIDGKVDFTYLDSNLPAGFTGSNGTYISANGHTFTVSEKGEVVYTGAGTPGDDETQTGDITLNGKFYISDIEPYQDVYIEIVDLNKFVDNFEVWFEDNETAIEIDEVNNKIIDAENREEIFDYKYIEQNGRIVNVILIDSTGVVLWQNRNGFEYDLDGTYSSQLGGGEDIMTFNSATGTVSREMNDYYAERYIF